MDGHAHLRRMFAYDDWANREVLAAMRKAGAPPPFALKVLAHILAVERLWFGRLTRDGVRVAVWPALTLAECTAAQPELPGLWAGYLASRSAADLEEPVEYTNTRGELWTNAAADILHHVILHSTYHRGQVASALRASGHEPAETDFIFAVRRGLME